jgi:4-oxalocrotonate tautomerase
MPVVSLKLVKGAFSVAQCQAMIEGITNVIANVAGEYARPHTIVMVEEVSDGLYAAGGQIFTVKGIEAMRATRNVRD